MNLSRKYKTGKKRRKNLTRVGRMCQVAAHLHPSTCAAHTTQHLPPSLRLTGGTHCLPQVAHARLPSLFPLRCKTRTNSVGISTESGVRFRPPGILAPGSAFHAWAVPTTWWVDLLTFLPP